MPLEPSESGSAPAPAGPSAEYRATATLLVGGLFSLLALLFVGDIRSATLPIRAVLLVGGAVLGAVAMLATAYGIADRRRWAVAVMVPMLLILIAAGVVEVVWGLTRSTLTLPFAAILGIWALQAPIRSKFEPGPGAGPWGIAGVLAVGALVIGASAPVTASALLTPGGPLVVASDALLNRLVITCDGSQGVAPNAIHVTYDWHWSRSEPLAAGTDSITLRASGFVDADPDGYALDSPTTMSAGVSQADIDIGLVPSMVFAIDLSVARFDPGSVGVTFLRSASTPAGQGSVDIRATYLHAPATTQIGAGPAVWRVVSTAHCEW